MELLSVSVSHPDRTRTTTFQRLNSEQWTPQNIQKLEKFFMTNVMNFVITLTEPALKMAVHGASTTCRILPSKPAFKIKNKAD